MQRMDDENGPDPLTATTQAPVVEQETPEPVSLALLYDLERLLAERFGGALEEHETISIDARTGPDAAWLRARVGDSDAGHEIELFVRHVSGEGLDGALGILVDFLDGVLEELFAAHRDAYLPLDFAERRFENHLVFTRSEFRHFAAEAAAEALLEGRTIRGPEDPQ